jgi:hypothetical protein
MGLPSSSHSDRKATTVSYWVLAGWMLFAHQIPVEQPGILELEGPLGEDGLAASTGWEVPSTEAKAWNRQAGRQAGARSAQLEEEATKPATDTTNQTEPTIRRCDRSGFPEYR